MMPAKRTPTLADQHFCVLAHSPRQCLAQSVFRSGKELEITGIDFRALGRSQSKSPLSCKRWQPGFAFVVGGVQRHPKIKPVRWVICNRPRLQLHEFHIRWRSGTVQCPSWYVPDIVWCVTSRNPGQYEKEGYVSGKVARYTGLFLSLSKNKDLRSPSWSDTDRSKIRARRSVNGKR